MGVHGYGHHISTAVVLQQAGNPVARTQGTMKRFHGSSTVQCLSTMVDGRHMRVIPSIYKDTPIPSGAKAPSSVPTQLVVNLRYKEHAPASLRNESDFLSSRPARPSSLAHSPKRIDQLTKHPSNMTLSPEAIIALIGVVSTLPPAILIVWQLCQRLERRCEEGAVGRLTPSQRLPA